MNSPEFIRFCLKFYGGLALAGLMLAGWLTDLAVFRIPMDPWTSLPWIFAVPALSWLATRFLLRTRLGKDLLNQFLGMLPELSSAQRTVVALSSGFGEEILFRGALLPWLGLTVSSLLFGLMHWPVRPALRIWTLYAVVMGFLLGGATLSSGSVWVAALAHALTNWIGFSLIERRRRGWADSIQSLRHEVGDRGDGVNDEPAAGEDSCPDRQA